MLLQWTMKNNRYRSHLIQSRLIRCLQRGTEVFGVNSYRMFCEQVTICFVIGPPSLKYI